MLVNIGRSGGVNFEPEKLLRFNEEQYTSIIKGVLSRTKMDELDLITDICLNGLCSQQGYLFSTEAITELAILEKLNNKHKFKHDFFNNIKYKLVSNVDTRKILSTYPHLITINPN